MAGDEDRDEARASAAPSRKVDVGALMESVKSRYADLRAYMDHAAAVTAIMDEFFAPGSKRIDEFVIPDDDPVRQVTVNPEYVASQIVDVLRVKWEECPGCGGSGLVWEVDGSGPCYDCGGQGTRHAAEVLDWERDRGF